MAGFSEEWIWGFKPILRNSRGASRGERSKGTPWTLMCEQNKSDVWVGGFDTETDKMGRN